MQGPIASTQAASRNTAVLSWLRLMRIHQRLNTASARLLKGLALSLGQFDVLARLGSRPATTQQGLARALLVTEGNISQLLERMENKGWVNRCVEGRTKHLTLTRSGMRLRARAVPLQERLVQERFACLSDHERATLAHLLRKLDHDMRRAGRGRVS